MKMTYAEFKYQKDLEWAAMREEAQNKQNIAYNQGLWGAVKYNPFKWWGFVAYARPIK